MPDWDKKRVYVALAQERRFGFALPGNEKSSSQIFQASWDTKPTLKFLETLLVLSGFIIDKIGNPSFWEPPAFQLMLPIMTGSKVSEPEGAYPFLRGPLFHASG